MIYIDPPYNTGKDFIYHDKFASDQHTQEIAAGERTEEGARLVSNPETNGRFHSYWLSMMYSRIRLARNLLREDGVIFISIDDNEQASLKMICDEIFGESNFVANFIWQDKYTTTNDKQGISSQVDYILCYAKSAESFISNKLPLRESYIEKAYRYDDNDSRGKYMTVQMYKKKGKHSYEIESPTGKKWSMPWNFKKETMQAMIEDGRVFWGKDGNSIPRKKVYLSETDGINPTNLLLPSKIVGFSENGGKSIEDIFGNRNIFPYPKPPSLIAHLLKISSDNEDIVLDFFAGSSTTAHSVMLQNAADGGKRKFIMVQLDEKTPKDSAAFQAGFETIAEIGRERIRRAGKQISNDSHHADWNKDIGFRVLKVDTSNMAEVFYTPNETKQDALLDVINNIKEDRNNPEDLLFQVLLDWGVDLTLPIRGETIQDKRVFFINEKPSDLIACFDSGITEEFVKELAKHKPLRAVFLDNGFVTDAVKINVWQIFQQISPNTKVKSI